MRKTCRREVGGETLAQLHAHMYYDKLLTASLSWMLIWIYSAHNTVAVYTTSDPSVFFSCVGQNSRPCHRAFKSFESRVTLFHATIITKIPNHFLNNNEIIIISLWIEKNTNTQAKHLYSHFFSVIGRMETLLLNLRDEIKCSEKTDLYITLTCLQSPFPIVSGWSGL